MSIVKNGKFVIPLFHGTTDLFIDSIKKHGLGKIDPLIELEAKEFMSDLFDLAESQRWTDSNWLSMREQLKPFVFQQNIDNKFNFRHGGAYLTYALPIAEKYARENPSGCEYLYYAHVLFMLVASRKVKGLREQFSGRRVLSVWEKPHKPYVIKIKGIRIEDIETEASQDIDAHISEIEECLRKGIFGPQSFLLKKPIDEKYLEIKELD